jgi:hypothetical protein
MLQAGNKFLISIELQPQAHRKYSKFIFLKKKEIQRKIYEIHKREAATAGHFYVQHVPHSSQFLPEQIRFDSQKSIS